MRRVLVLGLGNRLMMDDGVGVAVVEALSREQTVDEGVRYAIGETDFEYCLDLVAPAESLLIVDAAVTGKGPGEVSLLPLHDLVVCRPGLSLHQLHFVDLLLQRARPENGALIGIEPQQIEFHLGLSSLLRDQFDAVVNSVRSTIEQWRRARPEA